MIDDELRAAGIVVHDHRVAPRPGAFEPLAVLWHHVGNQPPAALRVPAPSIRLCQRGRQDLPGPLCQWLVDGDGGWNWITDGKANHAGKGARSTLNWVITQGPRPPDPPRPDPDDYTAGNRFYVGVEVEGNGNWSPKVHRSMLTGTRVLLAHYGLPVDNVIAHKEHSRRKPDPAGIDMAAVRASLRTPPTPQPGGRDMLGPIIADKTGADSSQVINIDGTLYVIDQGETSAAFRASGDVKFIEVGAVDYAQFKQAATQ